MMVAALQPMTTGLQLESSSNHSAHRSADNATINQPLRQGVADIGFTASPTGTVIKQPHTPRGKDAPTHQPNTLHNTSTMAPSCVAAATAATGWSQGLLQAAKEAAFAGRL